MFFDSKFRRILSLLAQVPSQDTPSWSRPRIRFIWKVPTHSWDNALQESAATDFAVNEAQNFVCFDLLTNNTQPEPFPVHVPFEDIDAVWQSSPSEWSVVVRGFVKSDRKLYT